MALNGSLCIQIWSLLLFFISSTALGTFLYVSLWADVGRVAGSNDHTGPGWVPGDYANRKTRSSGPVMLYPSRLATLKHRNPYTRNASNEYIMRPAWLEFLYHSTAANAQRYNIPNTMHRTLNTICI